MYFGLSSSDGLVGGVGPGCVTEDLNGESSESSGGASPDVGLDPHVAAVLFRMHRQLQQISRQLDLLEGLMINQQRLIQMRNRVRPKFTVSLLSLSLYTRFFLFFLSLQDEEFIFPHVSQRGQGGGVRGVHSGKVRCWVGTPLGIFRLGTP